jgi:hypothetical protein
VNSCLFKRDDSQIDTIVKRAAGGQKFSSDFSVDVKDETGDIVARATRTLYIRKKRTAAVP